MKTETMKGKLESLAEQAKHNNWVLVNANVVELPQLNLTKASIVYKTQNNELRYFYIEIKE